MKNMDHMEALSLLESAVELLEELQVIASSDQQEAIDAFIDQIENEDE